MERIRLTRHEKKVLLHVRDNGEKQPKAISPLVFLHSLSTLQEKGLVKFKSDYNKVFSASLTVKGAVYLEVNPKLRNPIDWKWIILVFLSGITAISTALAVLLDFSHWR